MHRNTKIVVICLAVFAGIVAAANIRKNPEQEPVVQALPTTTETPMPSTKRYVSKPCRLELVYPASLSPVEKADGSTDFIRVDQPAETITLTCASAIPTPKVAGTSIEEFSVGTVSAKLYMDTKPEQGPPGYSLIFRHPSRATDIKITGVGEGFRNVIRSVILF